MHLPPLKEQNIQQCEKEVSASVRWVGMPTCRKTVFPWESALATGRNKQIFKHIREQLDDANIKLGTERGEAPDAAGTGRRFSHMLAVAPNASSSIIMGNTSPSIEPLRANAYRQDTISGSSLNKNKWLN